MRSMVLYSYALVLAMGGTAWGAVAITPAAPMVIEQGKTYKFTANTSVQWSMAPGSKGSIDSDGTYHAPDHVEVKHNLGGCQLLPSNHIYNTRIDGLPVHPQSAAWIQNGIDESGGRSLKYSPSFGLNTVTSSTPTQAMHFAYTSGNDGKYPLLPYPPGSYIESGYFVPYNADADRHIVSVNRDTCTFYEMYNLYQPGNNSSCATCNSQSGLTYGLTYQLPSGATDAAGMPLQALSLGLDETRNGAINHALRFTRVHPDQSFLWPATASAYYGFVDGRMKMGARLRLKGAYDISTFSPTAQVLLTQLKQYGIILADAGYNWDIQTMNDVGEDPAVAGAFAEINRRVAATDLEVVDESSLMVSAGSGETSAAPEVVIATNMNNPADTGRVSLILKGVTVGLENNWEVIQSGVAKQFRSWVNGTANTAVTWSMSPSLGTLTSAGIYTAPVVSSPQTTTVTARSVADPASISTILVTVIPAGDIRMAINPSQGPTVPRTGSAYGPDSRGNLWWKDMASEAIPVYADNWYGKPWPAVPDISLFYGNGYVAHDWIHRFNVANGNYKITLKIARPDAIPDNYTEPSLLEAQGQLVSRYFDVKTAAGNQPAAPISVDMPAQVTDGTLYFTLRNSKEVNGQRPVKWPPILSAYQISADPSPPHITIDAPVNATATLGQTLQFYAVGWYMPATVRWSISPKIGAIDANGRYTPPATPITIDTTINVTATSTVDPTITATAGLTLSFGQLSVSAAAPTVSRGLQSEIQALLNGQRYSNVKWSLSPAIGVVNSSGIYSAPDLLTQDTNVTITGQSLDDPSRTASTTVRVLATPPAIRVNCGTNYPITDAQGNVWSADYGYSVPTVSYNFNTPIAGAPADLQLLYQSSRYRYTDENFYYSFPVANGTYRITLKFADYAYTEPGHYSFDVKINGVRVLKNFDPDAVFGAGRTAVDKTFDVAVTQKVIRLDFIGHTGGALINGIEIVPTGQAPPVSSSVTGDVQTKGHTH